jgi:hypothetical protein
MTMMFKPTDNESLRSAYEFLRLCENTNKEFHNDSMDEYIKEMKREIRQYTHKANGARTIDGYTIESRLIKSDWESYIELIKLPDTVKNDLDAEWFFDSLLKIEYKYRDYDCTGQLFTAWWKVFKKGERFYVYHAVDCDC